jgi:hypothetical protein
LFCTLGWTVCALTTNAHEATLKALTKHFTQNDPTNDLILFSFAFRVSELDDAEDLQQHHFIESSSLRISGPFQITQLEPLSPERALLSRALSRVPGEMTTH